MSLLEGPAVAVGLLVGGMLGASGHRASLAVATATAGGAMFGLVDDLAETSDSRTKGLRGHLGALRRGRLTTGGLKILGIGATSLVAAALATPRPASGRRLLRAADVVASGALIAGCANVVNLLDLRPGRALKAAVLASVPIAVAGRAGAGVANAVIGVALGASRRDLHGTDMLGDGGANAIGAAIGTAVVLDAPRRHRLALLAAVVALTLVSERVSFSAVIARTPALRVLDSWGRPEPDVHETRVDASRGTVG
ncbi:MAG TPA: hypothetical protein VMV41_15480 [Cellulomonadaceae bacterium]|nr:hypothetical protein [Cellulomonadaceae bacterium]